MAGASGCQSLFQVLPKGGRAKGRGYEFKLTHPEINSGCALFRGTVEDTELVEGLVLDQKASHFAGGITRVEKAKIGLIQFCISPPKTDVS